MSDNRVTMKKIAEKAGISIGTVGRALGNHDGINHKTKATVLRVARELGYQRNSFASALSRKKTIKIAVIYAMKPSGFYSYVKKGIERAQEDFKDYGIEIDKICSTLLDSEQQVGLLENFDFNKYDAVAINAAGEATAEYIDKMIKSDIPVITFNSDSPNSKRLFFVGNNARLSGRLGGELLGNFLGGAGKVAVIGNFLNTAIFTETVAGFNEAIQNKFPEISVNLWAECYSNPAEAYRTTMEILEKRQDTVGIFSICYSATNGIIKALRDNEEKSRSHNLKMVGYDLNSEVIEALKEGYCTAAIYQDPFHQGYQAVKLLVKYLLEGWRPTSKNIYVETKIILAANASGYTEDYLAEQIIHTQ